MDWSLVLLSQGIESTIDFTEEEHAWFLVVAPEEYEAARRALRHYLRENRRWFWRKEVIKPGLMFDWLSLGWVLLVILFYWIDAQKNLRGLGEMLAGEVTKGQWWRLFTATWLHADLAHLASNAVFGFLLLGLCLGKYGTGVGMLLAYLAGVGGNVLRWAVSDGQQASLGASGVVMAALGLLAVQAVPAWWKSPSGKKLILSGVMGGIMLFALLGLSPGTDVVAHLGGFLGGLLAGTFALLLPNPATRPKLNLVSGMFFAALVVYPWWLALRSLGSH